MMGYSRVYHIDVFLNDMNSDLNFLSFPVPSLNPVNTLPSSKAKFSLKIPSKALNGHPLF